MLEFEYCARNALGRLRFPILDIWYTDGRARPEIQQHEVFETKLVEAGSSLGGYSKRHEMRGDMQEIAQFLSTLDEKKLVKSTTWDYNRNHLRIDFTNPMRVGEYENIEFMIMTYYPWWARTEAMIRAHAEWRARVNSLN